MKDSLSNNINMKKNQRGKHKIITIASLLVVLTVVATIIIVCLHNQDQQQKTCREFTVYEEKVETCLEDYLGLPYQEALDKVNQKNLNACARSIDGVPQTNTYERKDIFFEVEDGKISGAYFDWPAE